MKICSRCKIEKVDEEFGWKSKAKATRQPYCKSCNTAYQKEHYKKNKASYIKDAMHRKKGERAWWKEFKKTLACIKCGENHPSTLDFHHRNPTEKDYSLAHMITRRGRQRMLEEVAKCDVLCANCHRKLHYEQRNNAIIV